jgi:hypothetical protein
MSDDSIRKILLEGMRQFVEHAIYIQGVRRIALVGSLTTEKCRPNDADKDPEEALVKLLEGELSVRSFRLRVLYKTERQIKVLHLADEGDRTAPAPESSLSAESENPIRDLQEYC